MHLLKINKRGVSPIIATLLLVAIAVAAAVVTYTWVISMTNNEANKSQTQIAIDKVMFGRTSAGSSTTLTADYTFPATTISVASTVGFAAGDTITLVGGTPETVTVSSVTDATHLVISAGTSNHLTGTAVTDASQLNGIWINIRNSGSIASTIDTVYLFKGDTLIFQKTSVSLVVPVGASISLGITDAASWTTGLTSGGQALPQSPNGNVNGLTFQQDLIVNSAYQLKIMTINGFQTIGTYYTPGSFT